MWIGFGSMRNASMHSHQDDENEKGENSHASVEVRYLLPKT